MTSLGVGTRRWVEATGGALGAMDRLAILGQGALAASRLPAELLGRLGLIAVRDRTQPSLVPTAETEATRLAEAAWSKLSPAFLSCHSRRTYAWARIIAAQDEIRDGDFDDELLYVCCLLHDLGLATEPTSSVRLGCFTLTGARALREIGLAASWDEERIRRGEEAITLHLNPRVTPRRGIEAHLLCRSSQLDALGIGMWKVSRTNRRRVFAGCPLDPDQRRGFSELFDIGRHAPKSRARMYWCFGSKWWFRFGP